MSNWILVGPKLPQPVWSNHLIIASGFKNQIQWRRLTPKDAKHLANPQGGPALIIIHGTGLRTRKGTAGISRRDFEALRAQYGPRILAFEHGAIRQRLHHNAQALLADLSALETALRLHVLGLSRGGLVARLLIEGWFKVPPRLQFEKLLFVGTPNDGAASARRCASRPKHMKSWRSDLRRLALLPGIQDSDPTAILHQDPYSVPGQQSPAQDLRAWPFLPGTMDQLPKSAWLQRLNGFSGPPPHAGQLGRCRYYAIASMFNFEHGAPNPLVLPGCRRHDISQHVFSGVPNDLVVPTAGVYQPAQGPHAGGQFPLGPSRLRVFAPQSNITHVGMLRNQAVRAQLLRWLQEP